MIPFINNTWQKPEAIIYIKLNSLPPREVEIEGVQMLLNWKGANPRCRFCKRTNHLVKDCKNLKRKIENNNNKVIELISEKEKSLINLSEHI